MGESVSLNLSIALNVSDATDLLLAAAVEGCSVDDCVAMILSDNFLHHHNEQAALANLLHNGNLTPDFPDFGEDGKKEADDAAGPPGGRPETSGSLNDATPTNDAAHCPNPLTPQHTRPATGPAAAAGLPA